MQISMDTTQHTLLPRLIHLVRRVAWEYARIFEKVDHVPALSTDTRFTCASNPVVFETDISSVRNSKRFYHYQINPIQQPLAVEAPT